MDHPLNLDILARLKRDTPGGGVARLIDLFIEETQTRIESIAQAIMAGEIVRLEHEAHTLKSTAATFGAALLEITAKELETACKNQQMEQAGELARQIPGLFTATREAYGHYLQSAD
ncbi:MAG: Hpt domain-containing protein [Magnetococcales bacterium]|nr:Hpt domain-containing protein [Magnetococcales bacterium]